MNDLSALVLFSGGQDSTTCLAWALERFAVVETVGFDYGQRHAAELEARTRILGLLHSRFPRWSAKLGVDRVLSLEALRQIGGSALTDAMEIELGRSGLPTTFVPGRNVFFLTAAAALAYRRGCRDLVGGMCETDFSGYPDCRRQAIDAVEAGLSLAMDTSLRVHTPLMQLDKAQTWALAAELGGDELVALIVEETVTCYRGDRSLRHDWGYGCAACPACELRANGYRRYIAA